MEIVICANLEFVIINLIYVVNVELQKIVQIHPSNNATMVLANLNYIKMVKNVLDLANANQVSA